MGMADGISLGEGSHVAFLAGAVARTKGPVLELGTGWWSTPVLHALCWDRPLFSTETSDTWLESLSGLKSVNHTFIKVKEMQDILDVARAYGPWGVIFVDNSPGEIRGDLLVKLKGMAELIVVHDTEADDPGEAGNYGWKKADGLYKYCRRFTMFRPNTSVYSDTVDFSL